MEVETRVLRFSTGTGSDMLTTPVSRFKEVEAFSIHLNNTDDYVKFVKEESLIFLDDAEAINQLQTTQLEFP